MTDSQEKYPCELASLMPRTFGNYLLPVFDIPVFHQEEEIDRLDIPVSGAVELNIPHEICARLKNGSLFVKPVTEMVTVDSVHYLLIVAVVLADII